MANRNAVARIEKITRESFVNYLRRHGYTAEPMSEDLSSVYDKLPMPKRATGGSAGYDFYTPVEIILKPGEEVVIPTFMKAKIFEDWCLIMLPKSGLGFKYHMVLANTIGLIDSDYYYSETDDDSNECHIMIKLVNEGNKDIEIPQYSKFCQGVFLPYGVVENEDEDFEKRNGGIGSTGE